MIFDDKPQQNQIDAEKENLNLGKQQAAMGAGYGDDQIYLNNRSENADLTRWQQDLLDQLERLRHNLKREYSDGEVWKKIPNTKPIMNDIGINKIETMVEPFISVNLMMSNYTEQQIYVSLRGIILDIIDDLQFNYTIYHINKGELTSVLRLVKGFIEPTHFRCLNNGERKFLTTINRRIETYNENPEPKKRSMGSLFGGS